MTLCINQSGTWKNIPQCNLRVNQSGTWRSVGGCINQSNTWRKFLPPPPPVARGASFGGGYAMCFCQGTVWIVSPYSAEVSREWAFRCDAITTSQQLTGVGGWFIPTNPQLKNPGHCSKDFWGPNPCYTRNTYYWSNDDCGGHLAGATVFPYSGHGGGRPKSIVQPVRAFRCVTY